MTLWLGRHRSFHAYERQQHQAKRRAFLTRFVVQGIICCLLLLARTVCAQDQSALEGESLDNSILGGRNLVLRLRGEVQFTDSEMSLVDTDPNYARFPSKLYTGEAKLEQNDGSSFTTAHSIWRNSQGLDSELWSWKIRFPLQSSDFRDVTESPPYLFVSDWNQSGEGTSPNINYWYLGVDKSTANHVYMFFQYRAETDDGTFEGHQLYEYVTWKASQRVQIGEQLAISKDVNSDNLTPWYGGVFSTIFLAKDVTSLRMDGLYYDSNSLNYQQYDAYLYQKLGLSSFFRLSYRYYHDSSDLTSNSEGLMLKRYFSARFSAHIGYRFYNHSEDANLNTFFGGFNVLL
jgi:hypothetical protein